LRGAARTIGGKAPIPSYDLSTKLRTSETGLPGVTPKAVMRRPLGDTDAKAKAAT